MNRFGSCLRYGLVILLMAAMAACASIGPTQQSFHVEVGENAVDDVEIVYGKRVINFFMGRMVPGSGGTYGIYASVPESIVVRWKAAGRSYEVTVPSLGPNSRIDRLAGWRLRFDGAKLEVWREEGQKPTGWADTPPYQRTKIYP